jgi:hypothetical protein
MHYMNYHGFGYELYDVQYLQNKCTTANKPKITWVVLCGDAP